MQFWEMLDFLMKTTQTSNRMLAQELKVDPSLISRLRTGDRNRPRQLEQLKSMSSYFAKRCSCSVQRQAIADKLNVKASLTAQPELLTEILYTWLCEQDLLTRNTKLLPEELKKPPVWAVFRRLMLKTNCITAMLESGQPPLCFSTRL